MQPFGIEDAEWVPNIGPRGSSLFVLLLVSMQEVSRPAALQRDYPLTSLARNFRVIFFEDVTW